MAPTLNQKNIMLSHIRINNNDFRIRFFPVEHFTGQKGKQAAPRVRIVLAGDLNKQTLNI